MPDQLLLGARRAIADYEGIDIGTSRARFNPRPQCPDAHVHVSYNRESLILVHQYTKRATSTVVKHPTQRLVVS